MRQDERQRSSYSLPNAEVEDSLRGELPLLGIAMHLTGRSVVLASLLLRIVGMTHAGGAGGEVESDLMPGPPVSSDTLEEAALRVLRAGDPWVKSEYGASAAQLWMDGSIERAYDENSPPLPVPSRPARLPTVRLVAPRDMPKLGKGGSLKSRQALVHSLVHTESWAIDLSWDIIARFGKAEGMPREFFDDFVKVAEDEGRHFRLLAARLEELGSHYGSLPAHDGLWDSAEATAHDLSARLAIEHCVHEARGLDVLPTTISRFQKGGDEDTAKLLESVIYPEEITHCAAGVKWFTYLCFREDPGAGAMFVSEAQRPADPLAVAVDGEDHIVIQKLASLDFHGDRTCTTSEAEIIISLSATQVELAADHDVHVKGLSSEKGSSRNDAPKDENLVVSSVDASRQPTPEHVVTKFHSVVRNYFQGALKPPFNDAARAAAGFGADWYLPLAVKLPNPV